MDKHGTKQEGIPLTSLARVLALGVSCQCLEMMASDGTLVNLSD